MGVRITTSEKVSALFDSVSGWAFGPTFETEDEAESFLNFTASGDDLRAPEVAEGPTSGFDPARRLCDDGSCVGVVGADGVCGTCGRKAD